MPPLPDPTRGHETASCLGCGYSLSGLGVGARCPECGLLIPDPERSVRVFGTAKTQERHLWRRFCWVGLGVFAFAFSQGFLYLLMRGHTWLVVFGLAALVASVVAMLLTGSSGRTSVECFAITTAGLGRSSPKGEDASRSFEPWAGPVRVDLRRVGAVWSKLRLTGSVEGRRRVLLDAGIRCPDADRDWVRGAILDAANAGPAGEGSGGVGPGEPPPS